MKVKLNQRLNAVISLVEDNKSIIDVGCDHALLSIYLVQNLKPKKVIASDIKEGPLINARENIKKYQVQEKIKVKLGYGIEPIEEDINTIIISGMGGLNIIGILKYSKEKYKNVDTIILSPNSDTKKVRKEICKLGFYIDNEILVKDNNIIYPVLRFKRGKKYYHSYQYIYGPILIQKKEPLWIEYMEKEKARIEKLLKVLPKKYLKRILELKRELKTISKII